MKNYYGFGNYYGQLFEDSTWDSEATVINLHSGDRKPVIYVPYKLLMAFKKIHSEYPDVEVGAYVKGTFDNKLNVIVSEDIYVPEQEVTGSSIVFKEIPPKGYNGVIHKHPTGIRSFSITDHNNINRNFEFSVLYEDTVGFCDACIRIQIDDKFIIVPAKVEIALDNFDLKIPREKIKKIVHVYKDVYPSTTYRYGIKNKSGKAITFKELMNKYGFKETSSNTYEKLEMDGIEKYKIKVDKLTTGSYKFTVIDPDTNEILYSTVCYNLNDLDYHISIYTDIPGI